MQFTSKVGKESLLTLSLIGLAVLLRFWNLNHLGLTHFDEGSYAMTGRWIATFGREGWIYQSGHAPGLFPTLLGIFFLLFDSKDYVAIGVSGVAGSLTIGLIYLIGRDWFGRLTGIMAALLLATAEYHLIYSRLALTDALFAFFFWAAIGAYFKALRNQKRNWYVFAGILSGLCWNTKYHGFFPVVIAGLWLTGEVVLKLRPGRNTSSAKQSTKNFLLSVFTAVLVFSPWFLFVEISVGYGNIMGHLISHSVGSGNLIVTPPGVLYFYLSRWLPGCLLLAAATGCLFCLLNRKSESRFLLLVFFFMILATMIYASFPRLLLPVVPAVCLLAAFGIYSISAFFKDRRILVAGTIACILTFWNLLTVREILSQRTDCYRQAANFLKKKKGRPIITQMSKNFYFYENQKSFEMRQYSIAMLDSIFHNSDSLIVAADPIIHRFENLLPWFEKKRLDLELIREFKINMYETNYYQGIDPRKPTAEIPLSRSPFIPGKSRIEVYTLKSK